MGTRRSARSALLARADSFERGQAKLGSAGSFASQILTQPYRFGRTPLAFGCCKNVKKQDNIRAYETDSRPRNNLRGAGHFGNARLRATNPTEKENDLGPAP